MKKLALVVAVGVALIQADFAEARTKRKERPRRSDTYENYEPARSSANSDGHNMAGCGLGSMAIESGDKWSQVGASFLNFTGMQTFAISFGTSGCTEDGAAYASREKDAFIEANLSDIRRDMSVGQGEYLSSLASLYGCKGSSARMFGAALQKNQEKLNSSSVEEAPAVINAMVRSEGVSCQG